MTRLISRDMDALTGSLRKIADEASQSGLPILTSVLDVLLRPKQMRIRPAILFLSARVNRYDFEKAVVLGTSAELTHLGISIHRTIDHEFALNLEMDLGYLPREVKTLVGDYLLARAAFLVAQANSLEVAILSAQTLQDMSEGGVKQASIEYDWRHLREHYLEMAYHRTAALFATSAESGAVISEASRDTIAALKEYGHNLRILYHLVSELERIPSNNIKDYFRLSTNLWQRGIITMLLVCIVERLYALREERSIELLRGAVADKREDWDEFYAVTELPIEEREVMQAIYSEARQFADKAKGSISSLPEGHCKQELMALVNRTIRKVDDTSYALN